MMLLPKSMCVCTHTSRIPSFASVRMSPAKRQCTRASGAARKKLCVQNSFNLDHKFHSSLSLRKASCGRSHVRNKAVQKDDPSPKVDLSKLDANELQTAFNTAIHAEDYKLAAEIRDSLRERLGDHEGAAADWLSSNIPDWLADRVERMGFRFPTEIQRRCARVFREGNDIVIQSETGSGKSLAFVIPALSGLDYPPILYPEDLKGPQCVIVVPTRELGVQIVMLIYKLFGGSVNPGIPGDNANMFTYNGPRGIKVRGALGPVEVEMAKKERYLAGTHVVVGTPEALLEVVAGGEAQELMRHCKTIVVDEVDACFQDHADAMEALMAEACSQRRKPQLAFVGATLPDSIVETAVSMGWLVDPVTIRVGEGGRVPSGLRHFAMVVEEPRKLAALCRQIRSDLTAQGLDAPPPRVIVFAASEEAAKQAASPLRTVLWGEHTLSVLLPNGEETIKALHSFRDNKSTLLVATPQAARGLDLPAVSHVYNLAPLADSTEYLHRAGRAGRIGSPVKGTVTTLITKDQLQELEGIAKELDIVLEFLPEPTVTGGTLEEDIEAAKKGLEDLFNLF